MTLKIVTPQGTVINSSEIRSVTLPTLEGVVTILDEHTPLMAVITPGEIIISDNKLKETLLSVSKGVLEVNPDSQVTILAETAERAEDIDIDKAEEARRKAVEFLETSDSISENEVELIRAEIEKELARINVGKKYRNVGGQNFN